MPESYIQLPLDSTGKKIRTRQRTVASQTVEEQFIALAAEPTFMVWTGAQAPAANKFLLSILNTAAGGGQILKVRKLFLVNSYVGAAITGVMLEYQVQRITGITGGTAITANPSDTADTAMSNATIVHTATSVTGGTPVLFSWYTNNDEGGLTGASPQATIQALTSILPEGPEIKELTLNPGEGFTLKQITSSTLGSMAALAVITRST